MPKFKIGDKVKIKTNLRIYVENDSHICSYTDYYCAEDISTIQSVNRDGYKLSGYHFPFPESMLEPVKEDNSMNMPKLETGMFIITKYDDIGVVVNDNILYYHGGFINKSFLLNCIEQDSGKDYIRYVLKNECGFEHIRAFLEEIKSQKTILGIQVLYRYEEPIPEVTLDQIYEKFGHKVKIVPNPLDKSE